MARESGQRARSLARQGREQGVNKKGGGQGREEPTLCTNRSDAPDLARAWQQKHQRNN
jgi:hypothetical protein